ncbi:MAG: hypothetical protein OEM22_05580 [Acidimicrobiia bacterium]|nr:hypothetical protein [Acidimicrobiia bacterium]
MNLERPADWRRQGLINFEHEQRIVESEGGAYGDPSGLRIREALAYLGTLLLVGGGLVLAFDVLDLGELLFTGDEGNDWGAFLVALAVALGVGAIAYLFGRDDPVSERAVGYIAALAIGTFAVAAGLFVATIADFGDSAILILGLVTLVAALPTWVWQPSAPTHIALHVSLWIVIVGLITVVDSDALPGLLSLEDVTVFSAVLFIILGIGWLALTHVGYMVPTATGLVLGTLATWTGTEILVADTSGWLILQLALGGGLIVHAITHGRSVVMFLGALIAAEGTARLIGELFDDITTGAIVALVLGAGALLMAIASRDRGSWNLVTALTVPPSGEDSAPLPPPLPGEEPPIASEDE